MRKIPLSVGLMIFGLYLEMVGMANSNGWIMSMSGVAVLIGFIWFVMLWDKLVKDIEPVKHYTKRVRKIERDLSEYKESRAAVDSAFNKKIRTMNKRSERNVKGYLYRNGKLVEMVQKEEAV